MKRKNYARGERHGRARVPDKEIAQMLELHRTGISAAEIARKYEYPERSVRNWIKGISRTPLLAANGETR